MSGPSSSPEKNSSYRWRLADPPAPKPGKPNPDPWADRMPAPTDLRGTPMENYPHPLACRPWPPAAGAAAKAPPPAATAAAPTPSAAAAEPWQQAGDGSWTSAGSPEVWTDADIVAECERLMLYCERESSKQLLQQQMDMALERMRAQAGTAEAPPAPALAASAAPPAPPPLPPTPTPTPTPLSVAPVAAASGGPLFSTISRYAFDQSKKFVKVYVTLPGVETVPDERVALHVGAGGSSFSFEVLGLPPPAAPPNARLAIKVLHSAVDPAACTWVRKADSMVLLKLRKAEEGEEWGSLDDGAKLAAKRKEEKLAANKGKSTQELLAEMYADADEDGKASLAAAWEAGRSKREGNGPPPSE